MTRKLGTLSLALAIALGGAATADAAKRFTIRGAGFGHGVGMSQYGAMGYASHGWDYKAILGHYYSGTKLGVLDAPRQVRVLLQSTSGSAAFSGASRAGGRSRLAGNDLLRTRACRRPGASCSPRAGARSRPCRRRCARPGPAC